MTSINHLFPSFYAAIMSSLIRATVPLKPAKAQTGRDKERERGERRQGNEKVVLFSARLSSRKLSKQSLCRSGWNKRRVQRSILKLQTAHAESGSTAALVFFLAQKKSGPMLRLLLGKRGCVVCIVINQLSAAAFWGTSQD